MGVHLPHNVRQNRFFQVWPRPEHFGWRLGLATSWEELLQPPRMWYLAFWCLGWRFSERVVFEEREMGLLRPCISEPEVPTETFPAETIYMSSQPR